LEPSIIYSNNLKSAIRLLACLGLQLLLLTGQVHAQLSWSEGACIDETKLYEGATRNFLNRGVMLPWSNKLGDWLDKNGTPQGEVPFSSLTKAGSLGDNYLSADVTGLILKWNLNPETNHGFMIRKNKAYATVFSRQAPDELAMPYLLLETMTGDVRLYPTKDTYLKKSTYRCLGEQPTLDLNFNTLIQFSLPNQLAGVKRATLVLKSIKPVRNNAQFDIYAVHINKTLASSSTVPELKKVAYSQSFEYGNWHNHWKVESIKSARITHQNSALKFSPYQGKALQITIPRGQNTGISADLMLQQLDEFSKAKSSSTFLRYRLRLSDNWQPNSNGKFPGLSGRYGNAPYRAGWGGRRSTGMNGWSARIRFSTTLQPNNQFLNQTPIGTYLYHADMEKRYGDAVYWHDCEHLVLEKNRWYTIDQFIQMNDRGQKNGELRAWVDGQACYTNTSLRFSDHPEVNVESVWLNLYHGGKAVAEQDYTIFIDELELSPVSPYNH